MSHRNLRMTAVTFGITFLCHLPHAGRCHGGIDRFAAWARRAAELPLRHLPPDEQVVINDQQHPAVLIPKAIRTGSGVGMMISTPTLGLVLHLRCRRPCRHHQSAGALQAPHRARAGGRPHAGHVPARTLAAPTASRPHRRSPSWRGCWPTSHLVLRPARGHHPAAVSGPRAPDHPPALGLAADPSP